MSQLTSDHYARWTRVAGAGALVILAWALVGPGGVFWNAVMAAGFLGATIATVVLVRSRSRPTLAQVIVTAETDAVAVPRGRGKP